MEQGQAYKDARAALENLDDKTLEKQEEDLLKGLEANIDACTKALETREEALINEVKAKRRDIVNTRTCSEKLLEAASIIYSTDLKASNDLCKLAETMCYQKFRKMTVSFSGLTEIIDKHGGVQVCLPLNTSMTVFRSQFEVWLPNKTLSLIYKSSKDGLGFFHAQCDSSAATLTLIRSSEGYVFGGFSPVTWNPIPYLHKRCANSFIFTLINPHGIPPTKYALHSPNAPSAVFCGNPGPTFGEDICICEKPFSNFPKAYSDTTGKGCKTFTGDKYFTAAEIDVYSVE